MKDIFVNTTDKGAVTIAELTKVLEKTNDKRLKLVRETHPYKMPQNYISWRLLSSVISMGLSGLEMGYKLAKHDFASYLHAHKCSLWFVQNAPIYCLKQSILNSLLQTDIINSAEVLRDLKPVLPSLILLFPQGSIFSPEGGEIQFCIVHLSDVAHPEHSEGEAYGIKVKRMYHEHEINLHWSSVDSEGTVWFSGIGLYADGRIEFSNDSVGLNAVTSADNEFLMQMRSLVLQCFLLLQFEPESILEITETETQNLTKSKGFSKPVVDKTKYLFPRWLGEPVRKKALSTGQARSHSSPTSHWRRGHWRRVAVGEGRIDRKWVRIAPVLVNP